MSRKRDVWELARGIVPISLGILLLIVAVGWWAFTLFPFGPTFVLMAILLFFRGVSELESPRPYGDY